MCVYNRQAGEGCVPWWGSRKVDTGEGHWWQGWHVLSLPRGREVPSRDHGDRERWPGVGGSAGTGLSGFLGPFPFVFWAARLLTCPAQASDHRCRLYRCSQLSLSVRSPTPQAAPISQLPLGSLSLVVFASICLSFLLYSKVFPARHRLDFLQVHWPLCPEGLERLPVGPGC